MRKSTLLLAFALSSPLAFAQNADNPLASPSAAAPAPTAKSTDGAKVIYDVWFTVARKSPSGKPVPYQYYNDRLELKNGRLVFQNHLWKKEDGYINEEQIGAFAEGNEGLTPTLFNFKSSYRATELAIDGSFQEYASGKAATRQLTVKIRRNGENATAIKKTVDGHAILSTFFSAWLSKRLENWKPLGSQVFMAILENDLDGEFSPHAGTAKLENPDEHAKKYKAQKISLQFAGQKSIWWVDPRGVPYRIEFPEAKIVAERATEAQARKFLK